MTTTKISINGAEVEIHWEDRPGGWPGRNSHGLAIHTVAEADLDAGIADGPADGEVFTLDGRRYKLGSHDYTTEDGETTCRAEVYELLPGE